MPDSVQVQLVVTSGLVLCTLITAIASVAGAVIAHRAKGEARAATTTTQEIRAETQAARAETQAVLTTLQTNNGGSTVRDSLDELHRAVGRVETGQLGFASDLRGIRRDIGRLQDRDDTDRAEAHQAHEQMRTEWRESIAELGARIDRDTSTD